MRRHLLSLFLGLLLLFSCSQPTDVGVERIPVFEKRKMWIEADVERITLGQPVTITLRCKPLMSGKGGIVFYGRASSPNDTIFIDSPVRDTLHHTFVNDTNMYLKIPMGFTAGNEFVQEWIVRFPLTNSGLQYSFTADAYMDSIFIADSGKVYYFESDIAKSYTPAPSGFHVGYDIGANSSALYLRP